MNIDSLVKEIESAIDDLGTVCTDLKDAQAGYDLSDVNDVYLNLAEARCIRVKKALRCAGFEVRADQ